MTVFASLSPGLSSANPGTIVWAKVSLPWSGIYHVDLTVTNDTEVTGPQTFTLDTLSLFCTATRALDEIGKTGVRLVGGEAGWRTTVPAQQYTNALMGTIVADVAALAGEDAVVAVDGTIGSYFRSNTFASAVLDDLFGDTWWMDPTGTVQTMPRPATPITSGFQCLHVDGAMGRYVMGVDTVADWTPGRSFDNTVVNGTISRVEHVLSEDMVRTTVWVN